MLLSDSGCPTAHGLALALLVNSDLALGHLTVDLFLQPLILCFACLKFQLQVSHQVTRLLSSSVADTFGSQKEWTCTLSGAMFVSNTALLVTLTPSCPLAPDTINCLK